MQVTINGETKEIGANLSITALIRELGAEPTQVAVEQNGTIVPKTAHDSTAVCDGDRIELVRFIGGG